MSKTSTTTAHMIYGCSECPKTWRTWRGAANHITRIHDGAAVVTETDCSPQATREFVAALATTNTPTHAPVICKRLGGIYQTYNYRSWNDTFECPTCGRRCRQNTNFLGRRDVICDGVKFTKANSAALAAK